MEKVKQRIHRLMKEYDMSMGDLSRESGIPKTTISRYLSDPGTIPTDRLELMSKALKTTPEFLMGWSDKNIYGNHQANLEYFADKPDLLEMYREIHENENLTLLFDTARELSPQDLEKVLRYMKLVQDEEL